MDEFQAKYYLTTLRIYLIKFQLSSALQYKTELIKLSSFQNFPAGAGTHSALLKDFPTPRCCHLQHRDTVDFVWSVLENSGLNKPRGT